MRTIWFLLIFASLGPAVAESPKIDLHVADRLGISRSDEPVCSGIPFPQGALSAMSPMHVETPQGRILPSQTRELGYWPDGSVKWLLTQFLADCPAKSSNHYILTNGQPDNTSSLSINQYNNYLLVNTGPLQVKLFKNTPAAPGEVVVNGTIIIPKPTRFVFELENGDIHSSDNVIPEVFEVEESGPVRATVHITGWLQDAAGNHAYKLDSRLRFYSGQTTMRADYTFMCLGQPELHHVKSIYIDLKPAVGPDPQVSLPGNFASITLHPQQTAMLTVDRDLTCRVGLADHLQITEHPVQGWTLLKGKQASIGLAIKNFYHLNPKAIEVQPDRIRLKLWSDHAGDILNLGRSRAKTHRILMTFADNATSSNTLLEKLKAFQEPLIASTSPEYFCSTNAFGTLSPAGMPETVEYDQNVRSQFDELLKRRLTSPIENCMIHYGDYYHGGYGNKNTRGNLEYDTGHGCFLLYARSGDRDYYNFAVDCNQHFIDMDIDYVKGGQRYHGYGDHAETHELVHTNTHWGHVFVDCPADAYFLTGDERSLQALYNIANDMTYIINSRGMERIRDKFAGAGRNLAWPLLTLCRAYKVTLDKKYLDAATKIIDYIKIYAKDPLAQYQKGLWRRSWMMDGCKPFMIGELHNGLSAYYEITHDQQLKNIIIKSLNWLIDNMWDPDTNAFEYEYNAFRRGLRHDSIVGLNMLVVDAFRFGYEMTGDPRYLSVAVRAFSSRVRQMADEKPESIEAKQFSQDARTAPHTAAYLDREHIFPDALPPSPQPVIQNSPPHPTLPRPDILLKADFENNLICQTPQGSQTGKKNNDIQFIKGKHGQAVSVGKGGYVRLPAPPEMLMGPGSIELWVQLHQKINAKSIDQAAVFHVEGETPLVDSLALVAFYNNLCVRLKDSTTHLDGSAETDIADWQPQQWHHVVITWDANRVKLYIDGKEQLREDEGQKPGDDPHFLPAGRQTAINLGWRFGNWFCDCAIDDLTIYGKTLSAEDIALKAGQ